MYSSKILKIVLVPAAALVTEQNVKETEKKPTFCRPSDLPIYVPEPAPLAEKEEYTIPNSIENGFATVRQQVTSVYNEIKAYQRVGLDYVEQSKDNAEWLLKYLRQEDNTTPKAGAIAIGGLTGLVFGLRGRFIKRTIYTATGALGMAAVCYPKEASEYSQIAITEAKKYASIAYNFAYGGLGGETDKQVTGSEALQSEIDAGAVVSKVHEATSQSCECPLGVSHGREESKEDNAA